MDKVVYYNELYGIYGLLLTANEQELFSLYYEENLSMQEIATLKKISKSAVGSRIKTAETKLELYEQNLHFFAKIAKIESILPTQELKDQINKIFMEDM